MPEGDTVFRTAHHLAKVLLGATLTEFDLRVPGSATVDLTGMRVHDVVPRGKHILHRIGDYTLHSHLRMEGSWHVYKRGTTWRRPAFQARAVVGSDTVQTVGFDLAGVQVVPTSREDELVGHLGPDVLGSDWDPAVAAARVAADGRAAHVALLDQRNVAGFGNEYAAELLFLRGVLPTTPTAEVDVPALIDLGVRTIRANRDRADRTFTGVNRPGRTTWVYGRAGRPCRRCGTLIRRGELGADPTRERITFWCPSCQR